MGRERGARHQAFPAETSAAPVSDFRHLTAFSADGRGACAIDRELRLSAARWGRGSRRYVPVERSGIARRSRVLTAPRALENRGVESAPSKRRRTDEDRIRRREPRDDHATHPCLDHRADRKSVVSGKSVDLGGRRIIKKKMLSLLLPSLLIMFI